MHERVLLPISAFTHFQPLLNTIYMEFRSERHTQIGQI
jgi:hypothetical protein